MARITAMQSLLATLQQTGYSLTNLSALSAADPNSIINQLMQDLINETNTGQTTMSEQLQQIILLLSGQGGLSASVGPYTPNTAPVTNATANAVDSAFAAAYQSRASWGYGAFRGQNL